MKKLTCTEIYERQANLLDEHVNDEKLRYSTINGCTLFSYDGGFTCFLAPDTVVWTAKNNDKRNVGDYLHTVLDNALRDGHRVVEKEPVKHYTLNATRLIAGNGFRATVLDKYLRMFPKGAEYWVGSWSKPVLVTYGHDHRILGLVMPVANKEDIGRAC